MDENIVRFEKAVKSNHLNFADWAGAENAVLEDRDIVGRTVHPDGGDMVLFDARGRIGFIGIHHDNWSDIHLVKVKNAAVLGYNLRQKKTPRLVPTMDLIKRYLWIAVVFQPSRHIWGSSPFEVWKTPEDIDTAFQTEAPEFADDPQPLT